MPSGVSGFLEVTLPDTVPIPGPRKDKAKMPAWPRDEKRGEEAHDGGAQSPRREGGREVSSHSGQ